MDSRSTTDRSSLTRPEVERLLLQFEDRYGIRTADLWASVGYVADEDLGMWLSLRSIHMHMTGGAS